MMHITEDTPPDMLAGAMDLTVHLPNGRSVKMSVERSTPMMDLLVQITTANHIQLSNHTLQALGMAPSSEYSDKILPFKPNTPIGALDTQHVKVLPKGKPLPAPKYPAPGHQPFESTFRLKVHLPRNQLYVTRVSRNVLLEDIMKKVCEEKNLDPLKYEFKHPGNLDEVLDPKLTLSDYQITEIYVVTKGTTNLSQAFSAADIMTLRKEEERKQMHNKTGGGVFNLIFKRGKSNMGSGSVSSDNRSISPTQSDDSRSVTPPAVQAPPIVAPPKNDPPPERPKPPQRKRRPAPKPPQIQIAEASKENSETEKTPSVVSNEVPANESATKKAIENGLTICHSRNSSDSSGYHEASILSDHCANTSLPRNRPKSTNLGDPASAQSTSNLQKMASHSRSTTSLVTGRKKKAAPPPPPIPVSPASSVVAPSDIPSPLVASQPEISTSKEPSEVQETTLTPSTNPVPVPRPRHRAPKPQPSSRQKNKTSLSYNNSGSSTPTSPRRLKAKENIIILEKEVKERLETCLIETEKYECNTNNEAYEEIFKEHKSSVEENKDTKNNLVELESHHSDEIQNFERSLSSAETNDYLLRSDLKENSETADRFMQDLVTYVEKTEENLQLPKIILNKESISLPNSLENDKSQISVPQEVNFILGPIEEHPRSNNNENSNSSNKDISVEEMLASLEAVNPFTNQKNSLPDVTSKHTNEFLFKPSISSLQQSTTSSIFKSEQFIKESKPPEIVGVIPKTPKEENQFVSDYGMSLKTHQSKTEKFDLDNVSIESKKSAESISSRNSISSASNALEEATALKDDELLDLDKNMFTGTALKSSKLGGEISNECINKTKEKRLLERGFSEACLQDVRNIPEFISGNIKKWDNLENLNCGSISRENGDGNKWVTGDASESESLTSSILKPAQTPPDNLTSSPLENSSSSKVPFEEKSIESTDSGIAQDAPCDRENDAEEDLDLQKSKTSLIIDRTDKKAPINKEITNEGLNATLKEHAQDLVPPPPLTEQVYTEEINQTPGKAITITNKSKTQETSEQNVGTVDVFLSPITEPSLTIDTKQSETILPQESINRFHKGLDVADIDWQYQLPSPPKAFRDSSPILNEHFETNSLATDFKDSVVTSPELFEKLRYLEDTYSEKDTLKSEVTSIASEEPLNTLSLEHLEKRMSLVYNRELSTSLKMTDSIEPKINTTNTFTNTVTSFETTYEDLNKTNVPHKPPLKPYSTNTSSHHTLPNFKITTYDNPKQNITVFEDDTIRSNTHTASTLRRSHFGTSMENISFSKTHISDETQRSEEREYKFYRPGTTNFAASLTVNRSGSFSNENRLPFKPVSRSRSTLTLNKHEVGKKNADEISRSNSLFDVSGLQSLEVIKLIQNKLSTPTGSIENVSLKDPPQNSNVPQTPDPIIVEEKQPDPLVKSSTEEEKPPPSPEPVKKYYYRGPPAINLTTWSERPKIPVAVKEDEDYKLGNTNVTSKLIVTTTNNNITSSNSIEVKNTENRNTSAQTNHPSFANVGVKINGSEQISTQKSGNVVIKIGSAQPNSHYIRNTDAVNSQRFIGPTAYRKPFSDINKNGSINSSNNRPHSIAFGSDFDISRVPVVRSVEFKKPYRDFHSNNTSVTHIFQENDNIDSLHFNAGHTEPFTNKYRSTENLKTVEKEESEPIRKVFRVSSFKPLENSHAPPVVRGFKKENSDASHRLSWNPTTTYSTLPSKVKTEKEFTTNQHVPFSQLNLRRTESNKVAKPDQNFNIPPLRHISTDMENKNYNSLPPSFSNNKIEVPSVPPPPPVMPKSNLKNVSQNSTLNKGSPTDARDMLLESIRNFGGKKGLKTAKA